MPSENSTKKKEISLTCTGHKRNDHLKQVNQKTLKLERLYVQKYKRRTQTKDNRAMINSSTASDSQQNTE